MLGDKKESAEERISLTILDDMLLGCVDFRRLFVFLKTAIKDRILNITHRYDLFLIFERKYTIILIN